MEIECAATILCCEMCTATVVEGVLNDYDEACDASAAGSCDVCRLDFCGRAARDDTLLPRPAVWCRLRTCAECQEQCCVECFGALDTAVWMPSDPAAPPAVAAAAVQRFEDETAVCARCAATAAACSEVAQQQESAS